MPAASVSAAMVAAARESTVAAATGEATMMSVTAAKHPAVGTTPMAIGHPAEAAARITVTVTEDATLSAGVASHRTAFMMASEAAFPAFAGGITHPVTVVRATDVRPSHHAVAAVRTARVASHTAMRPLRTANHAAVIMWASHTWARLSHRTVRAAWVAGTRAWAAITISSSGWWGTVSWTWWWIIIAVVVVAAATAATV